jgi:hypothetical protein
MTVDDPGEDVGEVSQRIDVAEFAGLDERGDSGPVLGTAVGRGLIVPGVRRAKSWSGIHFIH